VDFDKLKRQQRFKNKNKKDKRRRQLANREKTGAKTYRPKFHFDPHSLDGEPFDYDDDEDAGMDQ